MLCCMATLTALVHTEAATINLEFDGGSPYMGTAAAPDSGSSWNKVSSTPETSTTLTNVVDSNGANTAVGITITSSSNKINIYSADSDGNPNPKELMRDYAFGATYTVTLSDLSAGSYFLYVYAHGNIANQKSVVTVAQTNGGASGTTGDSGTEFRNIQTDSAEGYSYLKLPVTVPAGQSTVSFTADSYINGFQLTNYPTAKITTQPAPTVNATVGSNVNITVVATGEGKLSYQWRKDGVNINPSTVPSATTSMLNLTGVQNSYAGSFDVVITNPGGSVTSAASKLSVTSAAFAPTITTQPDPRAAVEGASISFSATVNGTSPLSFQWQKSDNNVSFVAIPGATAPALSLDTLKVGHAGYYRLIATNSVGSATSKSVPLTIAPVIATVPVSAVVSAGSSYTIRAVANAGKGSPEPVTYAWKRGDETIKNGPGINGATTASLQISGFGPSQSGDYTVTASNSAGSTTSSPVYIGVPSTQTVTFFPGKNAAGIAIDQQLRLVFQKAPKIGKSGLIVIRDASNNAIVETIDISQFVTFKMFSATIPNAAVRSVQGSSYYYMPLAIYGNEAWITLKNRLEYGKSYCVNIDPATLLDSDNAVFPGVTGTTWRFSTKAAGPAAPTASAGPTTITVGHDGTGDFATLQGAADWIPLNNTLPRTIRILPGTYRDNVTFGEGRDFVNIIGAPSDRSAAKLYYPYAAYSAADSRGAGTLRIESNDVTVRDLTIDNGVYLDQPANNAPAWAGPINTVATTGKRLIFDNVLMKGGQDTLYTIRGIAYFYHCEIWGSVDFIYGEALGVFNHCDIVQVRPSGGPIGAPNTPAEQPYGEVFLNCRFPRALVANGYPYDVNPGCTTFMRAWRKDGATAVINCQIASQISTKGWDEWEGSEGEKAVTCRAREYGTTLIGGGAAPSIAERQAAGAYWLNTIDPDYRSAAMEPSDPLVAPGTGKGNRVPVPVNPSDYTLEAIFGHPYFAADLNGWMPKPAPRTTK